MKAAKVLCITKRCRYLVSRQDWSFTLSASPFRLLNMANFIDLIVFLPYLINLFFRGFGGDSSSDLIDGLSVFFMSCG
jgi:hypothetical protein